MNPSKASLKIIRLPAADKVIAGQDIKDGISGHPTLFPNPPVPTTELDDENFKLQTTVKNAKDGDKTAGAALRAQELVWNNKYRLTADYVSFVAKGDVETIRKAGFTPTKTTRQRKQRAAKLSNFKVMPGPGKGTCLVSSKAEKGVNGYVCVAAPESVKATIKGDTLVLTIGDTTVYVKTSARKNMELDSLASSKPICVSMYAFNSAGCGPLVPSVEMTPQ